MSPASYQTAPPRVAMESGNRDSNPRPQPWQGCALPTELFPRRLESNGFPPEPLPPLAACCRPPRRPLSGGEGDRTPDLVNAIHALSQLSYAPIIFGAPSPPPPGTPGSAGTRHLIGALWRGQTVLRPKGNFFSPRAG